MKRNWIWIFDLSVCLLAAWSCGSASTGSGFASNGGDAVLGGSSSEGGSGGNGGSISGGGDGDGSSSGTPGKTLFYVHTDTTLYSVDPVNVSATTDHGLDRSLLGDVAFTFQEHQLLRTDRRARRYGRNDGSPHRGRRNGRALADRCDDRVDDSSWNLRHRPNYLAAVGTLRRHRLLGQCWQPPWIRNRKGHVDGSGHAHSGRRFPPQTRDCEHHAA